jgi:arabinofuranan 3-O-arabinosyltransferase
VYLFTTHDAWHVEDLAELPDTLLRLLPLWGWLLLLGACAVAAHGSRTARGGAEPGPRADAEIARIMTAESPRRDSAASSVSSTG